LNPWYVFRVAAAESTEKKKHKKNPTLSHKLMSATKEKKEEILELTDWQEKLLLEDIEATNGPLGDFNFIKTANKEKRTYGFPATELRDLFRYRVKYIKTLPIDAYLRWLKKYKTTPPLYTQAQYLDFTNKALANLSIAEDVKPAPSPPTPSPPPAQSPIANDDDTVCSANSSLSTIDDILEPPEMSSSFRSPMRSPGLTSPQGRSAIAKFLDEWQAPAQGTMDDPRKINVDMNRPENNGMFDIAWIPQTIVNEYASNVVCVRVDAAPGDQNKFQMRVPRDAE
jgi:hypothetical protein